MHADLRATRVPAPSGHPRQRPAEEFAAAGHRPRRPGAAARTCRAWPAAIWERGGCGTLPAAPRSRRPQPGGALDHSRLLPLPRHCVTAWSWTAAGCRRSCGRRPSREGR